jgi:hypothetical protein
MRKIKMRGGYLQSRVRDSSLESKLFATSFLQTINIRPSPRRTTCSALRLPHPSINFKEKQGIETVIGESSDGEAPKSAGKSWDEKWRIQGSSQNVRTRLVDHPCPSRDIGIPTNGHSPRLSFSPCRRNKGSCVVLKHETFRDCWC